MLQAVMLVLVVVGAYLVAVAVYWARHPEWLSSPFMERHRLVRYFVTGEPSPPGKVGARIAQILHFFVGTVFVIVGGAAFVARL